jgi:hypothetical protein
MIELYISVVTPLEHDASKKPTGPFIQVHVHDDDDDVQLPDKIAEQFFSSSHARRLSLQFADRECVDIHEVFDKIHRKFSRQLPPKTLVKCGQLLSLMGVNVVHINDTGLELIAPPVIIEAYVKSPRTLFGDLLDLNFQAGMKSFCGGYAHGVDLTSHNPFQLRTYAGTSIPELLNSHYGADVFSPHTGNKTEFYRLGVLPDLVYRSVPKDHFLRRLDQIICRHRSSQFRPALKQATSDVGALALVYEFPTAAVLSKIRDRFSHLLGKKKRTSLSAAGELGSFIGSAVLYEQYLGLIYQVMEAEGLELCGFFRKAKQFKKIPASALDGTDYHPHCLREGRLIPKKRSICEDGVLLLVRKDHFRAAKSFYLKLVSNKKNSDSLFTTNHPDHKVAMFVGESLAVRDSIAALVAESHICCNLSYRARYQSMDQHRRFGRISLIAAKSWLEDVRRVILNSILLHGGAGIGFGFSCQVTATKFAMTTDRALVRQELGMTDKVPHLAGKLLGMSHYFPTHHPMFRLTDVILQCIKDKPASFVPTLRSWLDSHMSVPSKGALADHKRLEDVLNKVISEDFWGQIKSTQDMVYNRNKFTVVEDATTNSAGRRLWFIEQLVHHTYIHSALLKLIRHVLTNQLIYFAEENKEQNADKNSSG